MMGLNHTRRDHVNKDTLYARVVNASARIDRRKGTHDDDEASQKAKGGSLDHRGS